LGYMNYSGISVIFSTLRTSFGRDIDSIYEL
jgi:hypothetical protein